MNQPHTQRYAPSPQSPAAPSASRVLFISWADPVPRSEGIARALGGRNHPVVVGRSWPKALLPLRYLLQGAKTLAILLRERPRAVLVMNPPIPAPTLVWALGGLLGFRVVIDSHTGAFYGSWGKTLPMHRWLARRVAATVVTNQALAEEVSRWGARAVVLPDALPDLPVAPPARQTPGSEERTRVCVVNSYSSDEPLEAIWQAARLAPECDFFVTGRRTKADPALVAAKPENLTMTDFLPTAEYIGLLHSCDAVMVLVTADNTLLCGAYEAVAVEKPLITSDWPVLRNYFSRGVVYVDNSPEQIAAAVRQVRENSASMREEIARLKAELEVSWRERVGELETLLAAPRV